MTLREALIEHLTQAGIRDPDTPPDRLYKDDWFRFYVGHRSVKAIKLGPAIHSLTYHDAHHLLTGYETSARGEAELIGWELASGGCGPYWLMWIDRVFASPLMLFFPRASWRAIRRGWRQRNLYRMDYKAMLAADFDDLRGRIGAIPGVA